MIRKVQIVLAVSMFLMQGGGLAMEGSQKKADNKSIMIFNAQTGKTEEVELIVKTQEEWQKILDPQQFQIARKHGTERAFTGVYWNNKEKGIYKCVCCGTDLFTSSTKFDSGTGWPSFTQPVAENNVGTQVDTSFFMKRVEVHCARCGCHLGHIFDDGPAPTNKRYCINSASLKFIKEGP